ncbi:MAG: phytanoyl-CoA dioxygenase family protein [Planctomycetota bacterium]|nr:phytanoyl-CoA dioxygenase family protein [Planctomycetota bacterium]MDA1137303.1 phytanoyl-CoA dioxygenase family protein [Planctomycetota bacterium]
MPIVDIPEFCKAKPSEQQLSEWDSQLIKEGYLVIPDALPADAIEHFRKRLAGMEPSVGYGSNSMVRLFEKGMDFVCLLENEPVISLMEKILGQNLHIIALQGHRMFSGNEVLSFHSDEIYLQRPNDVSDDVEYPPIINVINCHYYLVDVPVEMGPTEVVPGSHRACRRPRPEDGNPPSWRGRGPMTLSVNAGACVMYSNQAWHRGAPVKKGGTRLSVVPTFGRRFVAQRFWPFLNYNLSRDILDQCTDRQRELLGAHPRGAYG